MNKLLIIVFFAIACFQVHADEVDDLLENFIQQLKDVAAASDAQIVQAETTVDETDLYMNHAIGVFTQSGVTEVTEQQQLVNSTAEELTLAAITNNKPASVLTCINNQRETGLKNLDDLLPPFDDKINKIYTTNSADFATQRNTIALIKGQLPSLFQSNSDKMSTCVIEACFQTNLDAAIKQYDNLNKSLTTIINNCKDKRSQFNEDVLKQVNNLRTDTQSAVDTAVKKMGKC